MINSVIKTRKKAAKEDKKIVLLVINCLQGGGAERVVLTLGQGFHELGYDVHILRFKPRIEYEINPKLNYHFLNFKRYKLIPKLERRDKFFSIMVDRYVSKYIGKPDLVLSNLDRADSVLSHSRMDNIVHIIHTTLSLLHKNKSVSAYQKKSALARIYSKNRCVCVSNGVKEDFIGIFGSTMPTTTIHNPIDRDSIQKLANAFVPELQNYIIHVGSFKEAKRHDVLIRAYAKTDQSLPLLLLGKGKLKDSMKELVTELGLKEKVTFLGFHDNPFPYIKHAKFKVLTSDREGFALVIAESLSLS